MWETFTAYSAVVDRAAEVLATVRPLAGRALAELTAILNAPSVRLTRALVGAGPGRPHRDRGHDVTPAVAVHEMRRAFAAVADVVARPRPSGTRMADQLQQVAADLDAAQAAGRRDRRRRAHQRARAGRDRTGPAARRAELAIRWRCGRRGQVDTTRLGRLRERAAAAVSRATELAALREDADRRIAAAAAAVSAARDAWQDAMAAREEAVAKIAAGLPGAAATCTAWPTGWPPWTRSRRAGRWSRLASELDLLEEQAAAAAKGCRDAEQQATALLDRRDELRGLLDAYQAKAAKCGGAEDSALEARL